MACGPSDELALYFAPQQRYPMCVLVAFFSPSLFLPRLLIPSRIFIGPHTAGPRMAATLHIGSAASLPMLLNASCATSRLTAAFISFGFHAAKSSKPTCRRFSRNERFLLSV